MEVSYTNGKLQKLCNNEKKLRGKYGLRMAELVKQRLAELADAEVLEDMRALPAPNCHELTQNMKGYLAVNLVHPDRMAFRPADSPLPRKQDGGLDWCRVKHVEIAGIGDYH